MSNSSFLGPSAFLFGLVLLFLFALLINIFCIIDNILGEHQSCSMQQPNIPEFDVQVLVGIDFLYLNPNFFVERCDSTIDEDLPFIWVEIGLSI